MPYRRPAAPLTARVDDDDNIFGYFQHENGATVVNIRVDANDGRGGLVSEQRNIVLAESALSQGQQAQFLNLLRLLHREAAAALGYEEGS